VALAAEGLSCGYAGEAVLEGVSLCLQAGEMVAVLGRNGCGKSTLLRCLAGALPAQKGRIWLRGTSLAGLDRREVSRRLAVVAQELLVPFAFSTGEVVEMGRAPYARFLHAPSSADRQAVEGALAVTGLQPLAERPFHHLSGGEQQRTALALALAQQTPVLLLDEPTVHLDIAHQMRVLALLRRLCAERGVAVLAAMHDINLSCLYFDRLLVLGGGTLLAAGRPAEVVSAGLVERAFGTRVAVGRHPCLAVPQVSLLP
jgi:iron complex transport system ATP-binding protein